MTADIASLQRKLAEHADVIRHGRALADKVSHTVSCGFEQQHLRKYNNINAASVGAVSVR